MRRKAKDAPNPAARFKISIHLADPTARPPVHFCRMLRDAIPSALTMHSRYCGIEVLRYAVVTYAALPSQVLSCYRRGVE